MILAQGDPGSLARSKHIGVPAVAHRPAPGTLSHVLWPWGWQCLWPAQRHTGCSPLSLSPPRGVAGSAAPTSPPAEWHRPCAPSSIVPTRGPWALWEQRGHPGRDVLGRQQRGAVWPRAHLFFGWEGSVSSAAAAGACDSRRHRRVGRWRQDERWARAVTSLRSLGWGAPQDPASCLSRARSSSFPRVPTDGAAPHIPLCSDFWDLFRDFFQHWVGSSR